MKKSNWPSLLDDFICKRARVPFAWGTNDCAIFCSDWIKLATGQDPAANLRGTYDSGRGAQRALVSAFGIEDLEIIVSGIFPPRETVLLAQRGDVVLFENGGRKVLGILGMDGHFVFAPGEKGLEAFGVDTALNAWEVK